MSETANNSSTLIQRVTFISEREKPGIDILNVQDIIKPAAMQEIAPVQ